MQDNKSKHYLNYNKLEFLNTKLEKDQMLNIYPIENMYLKGYLSSVNNGYINTFYNYIEKLGRSDDKYMLLEGVGVIKLRKYVKY